MKTKQKQSILQAEIKKRNPFKGWKTRIAYIEGARMGAEFIAKIAVRWILSNAEYYGALQNEVYDLAEAIEQYLKNPTADKEQYGGEERNEISEEERYEFEQKYGCKW